MLLQRNFLVLIAVEAIENDNRQQAGRHCVRQGEKGRLVQSINNLYPVFLVEWIMERGGAGRGWSGAGKLTEI